MEVEKTLRPGAEGTAKYLRRFGKRLVCVRHRIDRQQNKRYTTVELILDERPRRSHAEREPRDENLQMCRLRVQPHETSLIALLRQAGARWQPETRTWLLYGMDVEKYCLWDRVIGVQSPKYG